MENDVYVLILFDKNKASTVIRVRVRRIVVTIPVPQATVQVVTIVTTKPHKKQMVKAYSLHIKSLNLFLLYIKQK